MKKTMTLLLTLALILTAVLPALPAMAETVDLPASFIPSVTARYFDGSLVFALMSQGFTDAMTMSESYRLGAAQVAGTTLVMRSPGGEVELSAVYFGGEADENSPASSLTLVFSDALEDKTLLAMEQALAEVIAGCDESADSDALFSWMTGGELTCQLDGYMLSHVRSGGDTFMLVPGGATDSEPAATETPAATSVPATDAELPECFVPQTAAQYFNGLLGPMLELLGAPDPGTLAEQYALTRADIQGEVLYLTSADGRVELNAYFEDGQPAVDRQATTLGLGLVKDVDRSELLSLGATFAYMVCELDGTAGNFEDMLDWMADAVDGGKGALRPMNGYVLAYAPGDNGYIFTLVPETTAGGDGEDVVSPEPEPTEAPTAEPTAGPTPEPAPEKLEGAVLEWNGLALKPVRYDITAYSSEHVSMSLYFRIQNNTDQLIRVQVDDITVDGVQSVHSTGIGDADPGYDSGEDSPDFTLINADHDAGEQEGLQAIAEAKSVTLSVVLKDEHFDRLYTQDITVDLADLKGVRDVPEGFKAEVEGPAEAQHYATDDDGDDHKPSSDNYRTLSQGDKGDDVKRLQQALIDLGYLNDVADGEYGPKTAAAVQALNEANGLGSSKTADAITQDLAFSGLANPYSEPWIPVDLPYTQWNNVNGDGASYRVKITNTSKTKTIKGVALQYYVTDVWGNRPWGSTIRREFTVTDTIKPGETKYSDWWYMTPSWHSIDKIHYRVAKVAFDDGTVHENDDEDYNWNVSLH